ncbi:UbiA family prenyltransferase [Methanococcoides sp. SA1]|nr:UbiA family prenyltransferase [Methanococcoides sp. SA1]
MSKECMSFRGCTNNLNFQDITTVLWKDFIYGGHIFAFGAICVAIMASIIFAIPITWDFMLIIYLIFYSIYVYDYFTGAEEDKGNYSSRSEYLQNNDEKMLIGTIYGSIVAIAFTYLIFSDIKNMLIGFAILILGLMYHSHFKSITKKFPAFKNLFVSLVWGLLIYIMFTYYGYQIDMSAMVISAFVFLRMMGIQILFDIRDIEGDRIKGLLTIPAIFGHGKSMSFLKMLNIVTLILLAVGVYMKILPIFVLMIMLVMAYSVKYKEKVLMSRNDNRCYILAAGEPVVWAVLVCGGIVLSRLVPYAFDIGIMIF